MHGMVFFYIVTLRAGPGKLMLSVTAMPLSVTAMTACERCSGQLSTGV